MEEPGKWDCFICHPNEKGSSLPVCGARPLIEPANTTLLVPAGVCAQKVWRRQFCNTLEQTGWCQQWFCCKNLQTAADWKGTFANRTVGKCSALKVILTLDKLLWAVCDIFGGHLNKILNLQRNMGWYQYNTASIWDNIKNGESHWRYICNKKLQVAVFRHHPTWKGTENGANINIYWKQCFQSTSGTSWSIEIIVLPEVSPYCRSWK